MPNDFIPAFFNPAQAPAARVETGGLVVVHPPTGNPYVYGSEIVLAVNVALATQRPLLVAGSPGTGKTSLASSAAGVLGWKFYPRVITSRTKAQDLMWTFDALRRLADAQASAHAVGALKPREAYVEPQVLWWAFDAASARRRGGADDAADVPLAPDPQASVQSENAVVLLDEIDKAEPDVPNDLLEALDTERFTVEALDPPLRVEGRRDRVLLVITTNGERELPAAFIRRCVVLKLQAPTADWLVSIADDRFGAAPDGLHRRIATRLIALRELALQQNLREPSTAEYLDALRACRKLGIDTASPRWALLEQSLLWKRDQAPPPMAAP